MPPVGFYVVLETVCLRALRRRFLWDCHVVCCGVIDAFVEAIW